MSIILPEKGSSLPSAVYDKMDQVDMALSFGMHFFKVYSERRLRVMYTHQVTHAGTDGRFIYFNTKWLKTLDVGEILFVFCHECLHLVLGHLVRGKAYQQAGRIGTLPYHDATVNICMDLVINAMLKRDKIGKMPPTGCFEPTKSYDKLTFEEVYAEEYKKSNKAKDPILHERKLEGMDLPEGVDRSLGGNMDEHLISGDISETDEEENETAIAGAIIAAKVAGTMPGSLDRALQELFKPQIVWAEQLEASFTKAQSGARSSYRRINRRRLGYTPLTVLPGRSGFVFEHIVAALDVSGSMDEVDINLCFTEAIGIFSELQPRRLTLLIFDHGIREEHELETVEDLLELTQGKVRGGGGTDFKKVFKHIKKKQWQPEAVMMLTDMYAEYPDEPPFKMIWVATTELVAPYGDTIRLTR